MQQARQWFETHAASKAMGLLLLTLPAQLSPHQHPMNNL
jgi:hypothetical protein